MILVVNAGSSSVKVELFTHELESVVGGSITEIGGSGMMKLGGQPHEVAATDHDAAIAMILNQLEKLGHPVNSLTAAAHRVVHGGAMLTRPIRITETSLAQIEACLPLAPLHNPHNLAGIMALAKVAPELPQFASFDTAFHADAPKVATTYALPPEERARGLRRYGFHGLSYAGMAEALAPVPHRLLGLHLGNGSSLCAMVDGKSVATSMGYSPISGPPMGTRSGDIDAAAVLDMAQRHGISGAMTLLNKRCGLTGLGGTNDMRMLLESGAPEAQFAVDHYCYWVARQAGSLIAAMEGIDAIAFTGGIGENAAAIRTKVMSHLQWLGKIPVHVVPADEERQIVRDALAVMGDGG